MSGKAGMSLATTANVAMIAVSAVLLTIVARDQTVNFRNKRARERPLTGRKIAGLPPAARREAAVTLALSTECPYCARSIPFYQELMRASAASDGRMAMASGFLPGQAGDAFLRQNGLDGVTYLGPLNASLPVTSVPTLLVSDSRNIVVRVWSGYLDEGKRREVYEVIYGLCPS